MRRAGIVVALLLVATWAPAQTGPSEAETLFDAARKLLDEQDYDAACDKLEQSQKLDPALGTLALLAYCHEMQGRTATAHREYGEAARWADRQGDSERKRVIDQQRERLADRLSTLRVNVPQPVSGLVLYRAGKPIEESQWGAPVAVDPGTVVVQARAPGYQSWTANVLVGSEGAHVDVSVPALTPSAESDSSKSMKLDTPVLIAFGVGAVGIAVGTYFGIRAKSLKDDSDDAGCNGDSVCTREGYDLRNDARSAATVANIAFGVGLAGAATGLVLMLTRDDDEKPGPSASLRVTPTTRGAWASFEQSF